MTGHSQTERFGDDLRNDHSTNANDASVPYASVAPPSDAGSSKGKGCGCWVMGCGGLLLACIAGIVALGLGSYWFLTGQVEKYTDTEPTKIPIVEMDEEAMTALKARIDSFSRQVAPGKAADDAEPGEELPAGDQPLELVLTADEINALIQTNEFFNERAHVNIEDGRIQAQISMPIDQIPGGKGRFFNADAELEVSMSDGVLIVQLVDATVKGEPLPEAFIEGFKSQNLAKEAYDDANTAETLRQFDSIEVIDDAIHLRLKRPGTEEITAESEALEDTATLEPALP